jgi:uncharacterized membrane protein YedE/YeeE
MDVLGFGIGVAFGAFLFLSGLANPDKLIGTLRLKDGHGMRVIAVFVLVGMVGVFVLEAFGVEHASIKPALVVSVLLGGALLGAGFGMTGYCPGTGLACAAAGRPDALVSVLGMLVGAGAFILLHPLLTPSLDSLLDWGKVRLFETTPLPHAVWALGLGALGALVLWWTRPRRRSGAPPAA